MITPFNRILFFLNCSLFFITTHMMACGMPGSPFQTATLPDGSFVCVWQEFVDNKGIIQSRVSADGVNWGDTQTISDIRFASGVPFMESDGFGNVTTIWATGVPNAVGVNISLVAASLPFNGEWSVPIMISDRGEAVGAGYCLDINSEGYVMASWNSFQRSADGKGTIPLYRTACSTSPGKWSAPYSMNRVL